MKIYCERVRPREGQRSNNNNNIEGENLTKTTKDATNSY